MEQDPMEMALSTDVVVEVIMKHLKVRDLLSCRNVCMVWNKQASFVLRERSTMIEIISEEYQLMKLEECMEKSWDFPFAGLKLDKPWKLDSGAVTEFFKNYGHRFTHLCLDTWWERRLRDLAPFIGHLPRLLILEMGLTRTIPPLAVESDVRQEDGGILKLPWVRIFRMSSPSVNEDVLREVLAAVSPSVQIECLYATHELLKNLKNIGKLRAISSMTFGSELDFLIDDFPSAELPSLTKVDLSGGGSGSLKGLKAILLSSQHTLKELSLDGICLFRRICEFPIVFSKLTRLSLKAGAHRDFCEQLFRGSHGHKFPALKEIQLEPRGIKEGGTLSEGLFTVPSVTRIDVKGYVSEFGLHKLAQAFPNVLEVRLNYGYYSSDSWECVCKPFDVWGVQEFKHLEKLRVWNFIIERPTKDYINMDSFLTGIPAGICKNLRKPKQLKLLNLLDSPYSEALSEALRGHSSIVQLKNLKELLVCVKLEEGVKLLYADTPFISMVSLWYVLGMMPQLRARFVYEGAFPPSELEFAFRDVQEYVNLEPYFY